VGQHVTRRVGAWRGSVMMLCGKSLAHGRNSRQTAHIRTIAAIKSGLQMPKTTSK
jgi:hypothetical protein